VPIIIHRMGRVITSTLWSTISVICEDFLEFVSIYDATGVSLASTILQTLRKNDLDLRYLHGQGYDGAAAMSGEFRGVQAIVREEQPKALYVHCSAYTLNLELCHSCSVQFVCNCIGTVSSAVSFSVLLLNDQNV